jgi:hypothetical protein
MPTLNTPPSRLQREIDSFLLRFPELDSAKFRTELLAEYGRIESAAGHNCAEAFAHDFAAAVKTIRNLTPISPP